MVRLYLIVFSFILLTACAQREVQVGLAIGAYDYNNEIPVQTEVSVTSGFGTKPFENTFIEPYLKIGFTTNQDEYVTTGAIVDLSLGNWVLQPHIGVGLYSAGIIGKQLSPEDPNCYNIFDVGLGFYRRLASEVKIGVVFQHFSHGEILCDDTRNPGANSLMLSIVIPIGRFY